jgi:dTDP-4-dehydrorhamnose reductase
MEKQSIVLVTGGRGMVGRNLQDLVNEIQAEPSTLEAQVVEDNLKANKDNAALRDFIRHHSKSCNFIFMKSTDADLRDYKETHEYFTRITPTYVIHLAAMVGGLYANMAKKV